MTGYPKQFIRIYFNDGAFIQGGTNHGIKVLIENDKLKVSSESGRCLINGRGHCPLPLEYPLNEISKYQIDGLDGKTPIPIRQVVFSKPERPIRTAASRKYS